MRRNKISARMAGLLCLGLMVGLSFGCGNDDPLNFENERAELRVIHLSPDAPDVDVWLDGTVVLEGIRYKGVSDHLEVGSGIRNVQVTPAGASTPVVIDADLNLSIDTAYTVVATGLLGQNDLQPVVLVDDRSSPGTQNTRVRFVHASPDAPAVDVAVQGGDVLFGNMSFRGVSEYLELPGGVYDLEVRLAGTTNVVLDLPNTQLFGSLNYTVFATGLVGDGTLGAQSVRDNN